MSDSAAILWLVALQQIVLALGWLVAARLLPLLRAAASHWAAYGLLSASSLLLYATAPIWPEPSRVAGNLAIVASMLMLQRGLRLFIGRPPRDLSALTAWFVAAAVCLASLVEAALVPWRVATVALVVMVINLATMAEVVRYTRLHLSWQWSLAIALPMLCGALVFLARGLLAVSAPAAAWGRSGLALSFGFAVATMLISLVFQLTLLGVAASRLSAELRRAARHDPLTGLLNRRAGEELLAEEAQRARRLEAGFALMLIDLDHFKTVNDRFGHAAGDRLLQHVATLLGAQLREIDRLVRWGGEEFVVLLPATTLDEACTLARRLGERLRSLPLVWGEEPLPMTASIGITAWAGADDSPAQTLVRADTALYEAKRSGRDRFVAG